MISDLRYVDPVSATGEIQTRDILSNIGTRQEVIDWVLETVRGERENARALERELHAVHMDLGQ